MSYFHNFTEKSLLSFNSSFAVFPTDLMIVYSCLQHFIIRFWITLFIFVIACFCSFSSYKITLVSVQRLFLCLVYPIFFPLVSNNSKGSISYLYHFFFFLLRTFIFLFRFTPRFFCGQRQDFYFEMSKTNFYPLRIKKYHYHNYKSVLFGNFRHGTDDTVLLNRTQI